MALFRDFPIVKISNWPGTLNKTVTKDWILNPIMVKEFNAENNDNTK